MHLLATTDKHAYVFPLQSPISACYNFTIKSCLWLKAGVQGLKRCI